MIKPNEKVAIGWIDNGQIMSGFAAHIVNLMLSRPEIITDVVVGSGPYLSYNRNRMVELFLQTDATWLFSLDSDLKVLPESFDFLCEAANEERPIVGGKYYLPFDNGHTIRVSGMTKVDGINLGAWIDPNRVFNNEIIDDLHSIGFGYSLIHRDVFETVRAQSLAANPKNPLPWFKDEWLDEWQNWQSDDVYFFKQVNLLGINVALDTRATSHHLKVMHITDSALLTIRNDFSSNAHNHDNHNHPNDHTHNHGLPSQRVSWWARRKKSL
jgi:hypothetical protein